MSEPNPLFVNLSRMLQSNNVSVINWNPQGTGLIRQAQLPKVHTKATQRLGTTGGTVYNFVDPPCGSWGELSPWLTALRKKHPNRANSWNPRRNHFGGLMPEATYQVTNGLDVRDSRFTNGGQYAMKDGTEMRLTCRGSGCNTEWKRSERQKNAGYANKCPRCGTKDNFTETGPHQIQYAQLTFPVALVSNPSCTIGFVNLYGQEAERLQDIIAPGVKFKARFYGKAGKRSRQKQTGRGYEWYNYLLMTLGSAAYNAQNQRTGFIQII